MKTTCAACGIKFSSPVLKKRREDGDPFWCPNGHRLSFRTLVEKEKAEQEAEAKRIAEEVEKLEDLYKMEPTVMQRVKDTLTGNWGRG